MPTLAFKEWAAVIPALASGRQILILRKGGIAEDGREFRVKDRRFALFPTGYHQTAGQLKPDAPCPLSPPPAGTVLIQFLADVVETREIRAWPTLLKLDPFHVWSESVVRERFDRGKQGVTLLALRVSKLDAPASLPLQPHYGGCTSWVTLDADLLTAPARPVLDDAAFKSKLEALLSAFG